MFVEDTINQRQGIGYNDGDTSQSQGESSLAVTEFEGDID